MTDPIADMLTRIRNAQAVRKPEILLPTSKVKMAIAEILKREGYIKNVEVVENGITGKFTGLKLTLNYNGKTPKIENLKRISKPGRRVYVGKDKMPRVLNNLGIAIISTSQGLMTNKDAQKAGLGGEVVCEIY